MLANKMVRLYACGKRSVLKTREMVVAEDLMFFASLLQEMGIGFQRAEKLLDVFLKLCHALEVTDPADPKGKIIARTLILSALEGEQDYDALYKRVLEELQRKE